MLFHKQILEYHVILLMLFSEAKRVRDALTSGISVINTGDHKLIVHLERLM